MTVRPESGRHDPADTPAKRPAMGGLLDGKVAVITGGGSGIGRATALAMGREGAQVAVADRNLPAALETAERIQKSGGRAFGLFVDVTQSGSVEEMIGMVGDRCGALHCAFNNAGISEPAVSTGEEKLAQLPEEVWRQVLSINLDGVWHCMKHEINAMLAQGNGGTIVNTASIAGLVALEHRAAYVASKHAVVGLTKAAAIDYAGDRIRANAICPGYIETPFTAKAMDSHGDAILRRVPLRRLGTTEEIAETVVWLCTDKASFITGATIAADGGYTTV